MPIPVNCACGRSLMVKDELAGKKGRCPSCNEVLEIPEAGEEAEDFEFVTDAPAPRLKPAPRRGRDEEEDDDDRPVRRRALREEDDEDEEEPERIKVRRDEIDERPSRRIDRPLTPPRRRIRRDSGGGGFSGINGGAMAGGVLMMVGAVAWFVVGLMFDYIFFYPPILFVFGIVAFFKGLTGQSDD